jgi:hypothetical protein
MYTVYTVTAYTKRAEKDIAAVPQLAILTSEIPRDLRPWGPKAPNATPAAP